MRVVFLTILFTAFSSQILAQEIKVQAEVIPQFDSLFNRNKGWTGADGDYSIALSDNLTLWLYSDTWVGDVRENRHENATLINNSVGLQYGKEPSTAKVKFFYKFDKKGKPIALIKPSDGRGWFWIYHGMLTKKGLYLFLMQIERDGDWFKHTGAWLGYISNPYDKPTQWRVTQKKIPYGKFSKQDGDTLFGSAVLKDKGYIYIYGADEDIENGGYHKKHMIVARVAENKIADFRQWQFYIDGKWQNDFKKASRLCDNIANEYSVSFMPSLNKYVMVYTEGGVSQNIFLRHATSPVGPWSAPQIVYKCPETEWNKTYICYAAKAHPSLSSKGDELIMTYIANSSDFFQMAKDARIYRPRFVRLKLTQTEN